MVIILLVEDDPADQTLTRRALAQCEMSVDLHIVEDGQEALDYLLRCGTYAPPTAAPRPDLLLLDLNLPKLDGKQVLERIRADKGLRRLPIVALTTSRQQEDIIRTYELGVNSFITKPLEMARRVARGPFVPALFAFSCSPNVLTGFERLAVFKPLVAPVKLRVGKSDTRLVLEVGAGEPGLVMPPSMMLFDLRRDLPASHGRRDPAPGDRAARCRTRAGDLRGVFRVSGRRWRRTAPDVEAGRCRPSADFRKRGALGGVRARPDPATGRAAAQHVGVDPGAQRAFGTASCRAGDGGDCKQA